MNWKQVEIREFQEFLERYREIRTLTYYEVNAGEHGWNDWDLAPTGPESTVAKLEGYGDSKRYLIRDFAKDVKDSELRTAYLIELERNLRDLP